jgi:hypothetical protein
LQTRKHLACHNLLALLINHLNALRQTIKNKAASCCHST